MNRQVLQAQVEFERAKLRAQARVQWIDAEEEVEEAAAPALTPSGIRMRRKRRREKNARIYWRFRLRTGAVRTELIQDALEHAPEIVEQARLRTMRDMRAYARLYPERCRPAGEGNDGSEGCGETNVNEVK